LLLESIQNISHPHTFCNVHFKTGGTLLVAQLVEALRYKPEGREFDSRLFH
jgi:hypothetical protein